MKLFTYLLASFLFLLIPFLKVHADNLLRDPNEYPLDKEYVPEDLVAFSDYGIKVRPDSNWQEKLGSKKIMNDLKMFLDLCERESERNIYIRSGYRSYDKQSATYQKYGSEYSAIPGKSEHQMGLAIDIEVYDQNGEKSFLFRNSPVFRCMDKNAYKYGFIQTYKYNNPWNIAYEPWHWRYVGKKATRYLYENDELSTPWNVFNSEVKTVISKSLRDRSRIRKIRSNLNEAKLSAYKDRIEEIREKIRQKRSRLH